MSTMPKSLFNGKSEGGNVMIMRILLFLFLLPYLFICIIASCIEIFYGKNTIAGVFFDIKDIIIAIFET